jgi:hypothetical protein
MSLHRNVFGDFDQMFSGFFGGSGGGVLSRKSPFDDFLRGFDDFNLPSATGGGSAGGNHISQTYVFSQKLGKDGKPHVEKYFNTNVSGLTKEGKRIGHTEEMYKNSETGVKKHSKQHVLGDQGTKVVKSKLGAEPEELHHFFHGMGEEEAQDFHRNWHQASEAAGLKAVKGRLMDERQMHAALPQRARPQPMGLAAPEPEAQTPEPARRQSGRPSSKAAEPYVPEEKSRRSGLFHTKHTAESKKTAASLASHKPAASAKSKGLRE